jgi:oxygen-independent coproporphyrinogen-3 oxidase
MGETMIMGLRLVGEGVEYARFQDRFGVDLRQLYGSELSVLSELDLVDIGEERVRLSARGRLLGNQVFLHFLPE